MDLTFITVKQNPLAKYHTWRRAEAEREENKKETNKLNDLHTSYSE